MKIYYRFLSAIIFLTFPFLLLANFLSDESIESKLTEITDTTATVGFGYDSAQTSLFYPINEELEFKVFNLDIPPYGSQIKVVNKQTGAEKNISISTPPGGWLAGRYAVDPINKQIALISFGTVEVIDIDSEQSYVCDESFGIVKFKMVFVDGNFYSIVRAEEPGIEEGTLEIRRISMVDGECEQELIQSVFFEGYLGEFKVSAHNGKIILTAARAEVFLTGTDFIEIVDIDVQSNQVNRIEITGYTASFGTAADIYFPEVSVSEKGCLITARDEKDLTHSHHLYLVDFDGNIQLISPHTDYGYWTESGDVVAAKGKGIFNSEFVLLKAPDFEEEVIFSQPIGEKTFALHDGNELTFINFQRGVGFEHIAIDITTPEIYEIKDDAYTWKNYLQEAILPNVSEVSYLSQSRKVSSMLSLPFDEENPPVEKIPAILHLHGGGFVGFPKSNSQVVKPQIEYALFNQLGYVVLEANYFGDTYKDPRVEKGGRRYIQNEIYKKQHSDLQAALEYLKSLPYVDQDKIFLSGVSYGATLGALYITSHEYEKQNDFAGAILHGGSYSQVDVPFEQYLTPRLAVRDTEAYKTLDPFSSILDEVKTPIFDPVKELGKEIFDVREALGMLQNFEDQGIYYYGVQYSHPESFLDEIYSARRTENIHDVPVFIMSGTLFLQDYNNALVLEQKLNDQLHDVISWYYEGGHYTTQPEDVKEKILRIKDFVESH